MEQYIEYGVSLSDLKEVPGWQWEDADTAKYRQEYKVNQGDRGREDERVGCWEGER